MSTADRVSPEAGAHWTRLRSIEERVGSERREGGRERKEMWAHRKPGLTGSGVPRGLQEGGSRSLEPVNAPLASSLGTVCHPRFSKLSPVFLRLRCHHRVNGPSPRPARGCSLHPRAPDIPAGTERVSSPVSALSLITVYTRPTPSAFLQVSGRIFLSSFPQSSLHHFLDTACFAPNTPLNWHQPQGFLNTY